jgi:hypothetical protein
MVVALTDGVVDAEEVSVEEGEVVAEVMRDGSDVLGVVLEDVVGEVEDVEEVSGVVEVGVIVSGEVLEVVGEVVEVVGEVLEVVGEVLEVFGEVFEVGEVLEVGEVVVEVSEDDAEVGATERADSVDGIVEESLEVTAELGVGPKRIYP